MLGYLIVILVTLCFFIERKWGYSKMSFKLKDTVTKYIRKASLAFELIEPINKKICKEGLSIIYDIFKKFNVFFYLSDGTCLGFTRRKDIISYDDDVDLGFFKKDKKVFIDKIIPALLKKKFKKTIGLNNFYAFSYKKVDFDFDIIGEGIISCSDYLPCEQGVMKYLKDFDKVTINDREFNIPKKDYLLHLYTKSWIKPIKRYKPPYRPKGFIEHIFFDYND